MNTSNGVNWLRLAGGLVMVWWTARLATGIASWCFLDLVNLAFHEAGHVFLRPFGSTAHYLGGTIFQLLVPAVLVVYFLIRSYQPLGAAFSAWWLGESLVNISVYMADARQLDLPLVGGGDHDWNELFYRFGLLGEGSVAAVSGLTHALGVLVMLVGLAWWGFFVLPKATRDRWRESLTRDAPWLGLLL